MCFEKLGGCAEQLPAHVDLLLVPGAVAHPAWPAVLSAGELMDFALSQVMFASDDEYHLRPMGRNRRWRHPARTGSVNSCVHGSTVQEHHDRYGAAASASR
jgi:hypothetical protein